MMSGDFSALLNNSSAVFKSLFRPHCKDLKFQSISAIQQRTFPAVSLSLCLSLPSVSSPLSIFRPRRLSLMDIGS